MECVLGTVRRIDTYVGKFDWTDMSFERECGSSVRLAGYFEELRALMTAHPVTGPFECTETPTILIRLASREHAMCAVQTVMAGELTALMNRLRGGVGPWVDRWMLGTEAERKGLKRRITDVATACMDQVRWSPEWTLSVQEHTMEVKWLGQPDTQVLESMDMARGWLVLLKEKLDRVAEEAARSRLVPVATPEDCAVCCSSMESGAVRVVGCGHCYHMECVIEVLRRSETGTMPCPLCRQEIVQ